MEAVENTVESVAVVTKVTEIRIQFLTERDGVSKSINVHVTDPETCLREYIAPNAPTHDDADYVGACLDDLLELGHMLAAEHQDAGKLEVTPDHWKPLEVSDPATSSGGQHECPLAVPVTDEQPPVESNIDGEAAQQ